MNNSDKIRSFQVVGAIVSLLGFFAGLLWIFAPNGVKQDQLVELDFSTREVGWRTMVGQPRFDENSGVSWVTITMDGRTNNPGSLRPCCINLQYRGMMPSNNRYWRENPTNNTQEVYVYVNQESGLWFVRRDAPLRDP